MGGENGNRIGIGQGMSGRRAGKLKRSGKRCCTQSSMFYSVPFMPLLGPKQNHFQIFQRIPVFEPDLTLHIFVEKVYGSLHQQGYNIISYTLYYATLKKGKTCFPNCNIVSTISDSLYPTFLVLIQFQLSAGYAL